MERAEATWQGEGDLMAVQHSFEDFFELEQERLLRLLWMVTGSLQEAEDIVQEAFLRVWERWHKVSVMESHTGYLHHAAMNIFRNRYRRAKLGLRKAIGAEPPVDAFGVVEDRISVSSALGTLTPKQRAALVLTDLLGYTPDGTRIALTSADGGVFSVDVRSGDRRLLARLPNVDQQSVDEIQWSPDGTHIAVMNTRADGEARLHVMNADGSDVRVVAENYHPLGIAWSPDGTQLAFAKGVQADGTVVIWVASMDGGDPADIGFVPYDGCTYSYMCGVTWSTDGSAVGFHKDEAEDSVIAADGSGKVELIDELTYRSWAGGSYGEA